MNDTDLSKETGIVRDLLAETREQLAPSYHKELVEWLFGSGEWDKGCPFLTKTYPKILEVLANTAPGISPGTSADMETFFKGQATVMANMVIENPRENYSPYLDIIEEITGNGGATYTTTSGWASLRKVSTGEVKKGTWDTPTIITLANLEEFTADILGGPMIFRSCPKLHFVKFRQIVRKARDQSPHYGKMICVTPSFEECAQGLILDLSECKLGNAVMFQTPATMTEVAQMYGAPFGLDTLHGKIICTDGTISY